MSIAPSFINSVGGAGNGKGLEAPENKPGISIERKGLSEENNSSVVSAIPVLPQHMTVGRLTLEGAK